MSITIGLWVAPLIVTFGSLAWALLTPSEPSNGSKYFADPLPLVRFVVAVFVSLVAWLIWAIFK